MLVAKSLLLQLPCLVRMAHIFSYSTRLSSLVQVQKKTYTKGDLEEKTVWRTRMEIEEQLIFVASDWHILILKDSVIRKIES